VHGILKHPYTYQSVIPEEVGRKISFVFDKYSGKALLKHKLDEFGIEVPEHLLEKLRIRLIKKAYNLKRALTDDELKIEIRKFLMV
jgi:isopropylmalate/homocitrate/citramalate synthase